MTASIQTKGTPFMTVNNAEVRLQQYVNALRFYLDQKHIDKVVFCDNTLFEYDFHELYEMAEKKGKKLEILQFQGNSDMVGQKGKGYGEGETIKYVLEHSELMQNETTFAKVTGRYIIKNVDQIVAKAKKGKNYFILSGLRFPGVNTLFYIADKEEYRKHLMDCFESVDDANLRSLERVVWSIFKEGNMKYQCLPEYPQLIGISGTSGEDLGKFSVQKMIKDVWCRLGIYNWVVRKSL